MTDSPTRSTALSKAEHRFTANRFGAGYRFRTEHADWTLRLNVENVLDERYFESCEFYPGDSGYLSYGAPIHARFSVQVDF